VPKSALFRRFDAYFGPVKRIQNTFRASTKKMQHVKNRARFVIFPVWGPLGPLTTESN
jgi:hypothetical protein